jgi:hypothetical protein
VPTIDPKLARVLGDIALKHSAQILIAEELTTGGWELHNGTATLLQLGSKKFAVTCWHVIAKHRKTWSEGRTSLFHIASFKFEPLHQQVFEDENLDLAVI